MRKMNKASQNCDESYLNVEHEVVIRECTRNSNKKNYRYICKRVKLEKPTDVKLKIYELGADKKPLIGQDGKKIVKEIKIIPHFYENQVKKAQKAPKVIEQTATV